MKPLRVLIIHNRYRIPGGEDRVVEAEARLLRERGHEVLVHTRSNVELESEGFVGRTAAAWTAVWSRAGAREVLSLVRDFRPDVAHVHNVFHVISPAVYRALARSGVPVVQTLHNYRLLCPGALFLRDGSVCEACLGRFFAWPGVVHRCYRGSLGASLAVAGSVAAHRLLGTWDRAVTLYIALTEFARNKFIVAGFPPERVVVKPNFVYPPASEQVRSGPGDFFLYVGRLSPEKGVGTLLSAWRSRELSRVPLVVCGDGPLAGEVREAAALSGGAIRYLGRVGPKEVARLMGKARALLFPSLCYETFSLVIAEAYAGGLPVLASRLGAAAELVEDGVTGVLLSPGEPEAWRQAVLWAWGEPSRLSAMGERARRVYEDRYSPEANYRLLLQIYYRVLGKEVQKDVPAAAV